MKRTAIDDDGGGDEDEMKREMNLRKRRTTLVPWPLQQ
jgi:hypothetical protein